MKTISSSDFISKLIAIHGDKYDYSQVEYINSVSLIKVICRVHGLFEQKAYKHLGGQGCETCSRLRTKEKLLLSQEDVIANFIKKHGAYYDYIESRYINNLTPIRIKCPLHGFFNIRPKDHKERFHLVYAFPFAGLCLKVFYLSILAEIGF